MQLIDDIKNIWKRDIKVKDRLSFSLVLTGLLAIYYYSRYTKLHVPFMEYQWEVYALISILVSFVLINFWGNFILRIWLTIAGIVGKIMNIIIFFVLYFVILTPIFIIRNQFLRKKKLTETNWTSKMYINSDHFKMG